MGMLDQLSEKILSLWEKVSRPFKKKWSNLDIFLWIAAAFMALSALVFFPSFSSIFMLLFALVAIPLDPVKNFWGKLYIRGIIKAAALILIFVVSMVIYGAEMDPHEEKPPVSPLSSSSSDFEKEFSSHGSSEVENKNSREEVQEPVVLEPEPEPESEPEPEQQELPQEEPSQESPPPIPQEPESKPEEQIETAPQPTIDPEQAFREMLQQYRFVGSSESNKAHVPRCRWTSEINDSNLVHFDSKEEAEAAGYSACGTCNPF